MKLEDKIKKTLENRRIEPTASAWDRIEGKLEVSQGRKKSKVVLWVGIAASFVAGVFLTTLLFSSDVSEISNEVVITQDGIENSKEVEVPSFKQPQDDLLHVAEVSGKEEETREEKQDVGRSPLSRKRNSNKKTATSGIRHNIYISKIPKATTVETAVATTEKKEVSVDAEKSLEVHNIENIMEIEAVTTVVTTTVTDDEIAALLLNAQKEVKGRSAHTPSAFVVDANELLLDVEAEVDPNSFKDKIFSTLKKEISKAVEAVANKDN